jgi:hypothetical protein
MESAVGQVYRWSLSHGKGGKHCTLLVVSEDGPSGPMRCLVIDGNHALGYGDVSSGQSIKIYGWYYLNQMKRLM